MTTVDHLISLTRHALTAASLLPTAPPAEVGQRTEEYLEAREALHAALRAIPLPRREPPAVITGVLHDLKVWHEYFDALKDGSKTFEVRKNDRDFKVGDTLNLREWDPVSETYSGSSCTRTVVYVLARDHRLAPGFVILGLY